MNKKSKAVCVIGIIPARMASSRFPGKPLAKILGIPMIGHVYFRSKASKTLDEVYIATCDKEIIDYAESIGAKAVMTKDTHQRASDRAAEAMLKIESEIKKELDIAVMIQGDEPMIVPAMIDLAVEPLLNDESILLTNLMSELKTEEEENDSNLVKVVFDKNNFALYFSREPIPTRKKGIKNIPIFKQICIIPFRRDFLLKFNELSQTSLEIAEYIDMLRVLQHGYKIKMVLINFETYGVDTPRDLEKVRKLMEKDTLRKNYSALS